jgi:undecaprenyl-diphosphatase
VLDDRFKWLKYWLFIWAVLVSYSRIYNGVHYPGEVIGGAAIGLLLGWMMAKLYQNIVNRNTLETV